MAGAVAVATNYKHPAALQTRSRSATRAVRIAPVGSYLTASATAVVPVYTLVSARRSREPCASPSRERNDRSGMEVEDETTVRSPPRAATIQQRPATLRIR